MPTPVLSEYRHSARRKRNFGALYLAIILLSLHWSTVVYINSSYLEQYVGNAALGVLYTSSSALTVLAFLFISRVLQKTGNYRLSLVLILLEFTSLIGMALADSLRIAIPLFMVHQAVVPLLIFNLDIYMEEMIGQEESRTGGKRGLYLMCMSFAGALSPLAAGFLIESGEEPRFAFAYVCGALFLVPLLFILVRFFRTFSDPHYSETTILPSLRSLWLVKDIRNVFFAHFLLQLFFVWTVIYIPLYLARYAGFNWQEVGLILFVGLFAYVILEYPIGVIADTWLGEKEMMALGFMVLGISVSWLTFLEGAGIALWMFVMFMTRVGASLIEVTSESYFFKHTRGADAEVISFFRITRPLSYVVGALLGSLILLYLPFNLLFVTISLLMVPGLFFAMALHDTK